MTEIHLPKFKSKEFFLSIILIFTLSHAFGQVSFSQSEEMISDVYSQISILSADLNNDQQDDLVFFDFDNKLTIQINNGLGRYWKKIIGPVIAGTAWAGMVADFNNDGFQEIVVGTANSFIRIYTYNYITETLTLYEQLPQAFFVQNINASDINNDGLIDLFLCNDTGENFIFYNDGNSGFEQSYPFDFTTDPPSDKSGNYSSIFIDFDLDGDRDLYISKCSAFANEATDPRRINQLFVNDGEGGFTEQAAEFNLNIGAQSWVSNFADLDLDGDLDMIVANHYDELMLLENDKGIYIEIQKDSGIELFNFFWQVSLHDFDNDSYQDILISADDIYYYHNNGDMTFDKVPFFKYTDNNKASTHSVGDYNNDGFLDFVLSYGTISTTSNVSDSLFINEGNDNNWVMLALEGSDQNIDAEGSRVELYSDGVKQIRIVHLGHSYGILDSKTLHFGLGKGEVDSVFIYWDGINKTEITDVEINRKYYVKEDVCLQEIKAPVLDSERLCQGDSLEILFDEIDFNYWQDNSTNSSYIGKTEDVIYANYGDECQLEAWKVALVFDDTTSLYKEDQVKYGLFLPCPEDEVVLDSQGENPLWNKVLMQDSFLISNGEEVLHEYEMGCQHVYHTFYREDADVDFNTPKSEYKYVDGEDVEINLDNPNVTWHDNISDEIFHTGASYVFENQTQDYDFYVLNNFSQSFKEFAGLEEKNDETGGYPSSNLNVLVSFEVDQEMVLKSVDAYTEIDGIRRFLIYRPDYSLYFSKDVFIGVDQKTVELNATLAPGSYFLITDLNVNIENLGTAGPLLYRETGNYIKYPYEDPSGNFRIIKNSLESPVSYYSFYNWQIEGVNEKECSERFDIKLVDVLDIEEAEHLSISFNNPVNDQLMVESEMTLNYLLYDNLGHLIKQGAFNKGQNVVNLQSAISGIYYLRLLNGKVYKIIKS